MNRPILLDAYSGSGGAGVGYFRAGFDVVGIDNKLRPLKHYPFPWACMDALEALRILIAGQGITFSDGREYRLGDLAAIHASPPCQLYTPAGQQWRKQGREYPDLIDATRKALKVTGRPYVIENVPGAPLVNPVVLNGSMFHRRVRRTRLFECSFDVPFHLLPKEGPSGIRMGRPVREGDIITPVGHFSNIQYARQEMGIDWMTGQELTQAIPPAFTEFVGRQLRAVLTQEGHRKESEI